MHFTRTLDDVTSIVETDDSGKWDTIVPGAGDDTPTRKTLVPAGGQRRTRLGTRAVRMGDEPGVQPARHARRILQAVPGSSAGRAVQPLEGTGIGISGGGGGQHLLAIFVLAPALEGGDRAWGAFAALRQAR
jgi:hypothetical protein